MNLFEELKKIEEYTYKLYNEFYDKRDDVVCDDEELVFEVLATELEEIHEKIKACRKHKKEFLELKKDYPKVFEKNKDLSI